MTVLSVDLLHDPVGVCNGGGSGVEGKLQTASLSDTGPVSFSSGGLDAVQREFSDAFGHLSKIGATLVSLEPPMWVHDGCEEVADFIRFAEQELVGKPESEWAQLDNPGAYALQERFGIPKANADGLRDELKPLSSLTQKLAGAEHGFLEASTGWAGTAPVKRYTQGPGQDLPEIARIGGERVLALERVHVDRNRNREDREGCRNPMRLTLILSFDETGGTYFPFAELLQETSGVESLPTALDQRSTHAGAGETWPVADLGSGRGVLVRGKRGRLLVFASSAGDRRVPLYSSLHQGVLLRPIGSSEGSAASRMVTVIGAHGVGQYETSAFHECLEHESIETRAEVFGRTVEQEAAGIYMTANSQRREEAYEFLQRRAELRRTNVEELIQQQVRLHPEWARLPEAPMRPASSAPSPFTEPAGRSSADAGDGHDSGVVPKIFWRETCSVCMDQLRQPGDTDADKTIPGYMSCGHVICKECHDAITSHVHATFGASRALCPECRRVSRHTWRPLLVDGKWIDGVDAAQPSEPAGASAPQRRAPAAEAAESSETGTWNDPLQRLRQLIRTAFRRRYPEGQEPLMEEPPAVQAPSGADAGGSIPPEERWL